MAILAQLSLNAALGAAFAPVHLSAFLASWMMSPLLIVVVLSIVIGLLMIVLFGYTSDQKAIGIAKDQLKAHLLAVRLYRDQLHVVMGSYGKVLRGTGRYLKLAFKPLLYVIIPITLMIVWLDRSLGLTAIQTNTPFLMTAHVDDPQALDNISIDLPPGIEASAPPVHISADNEVVWRLVATQEGTYDVKIAVAGQTVTKSVRVTTQLAQLSPERWRDHLWQRLFSSGESALPQNSAVESIVVDYPERNIPLGVAGYEMNWIWLFFILSMIAGFIFKELLGIKV
ncbi:MAG TPA: hypothetical protein VMI10_20105 [Terriglobales bacterium]|nr:hypothetical protein [Terriglobales bacterium]